MLSKAYFGHLPNGKIWKFGKICSSSAVTEVQPGKMGIHDRARKQSRWSMGKYSVAKDQFIILFNFTTFSPLSVAAR